MPRPPVFAQWVNGQPVSPLLFGQLVVLKAGTDNQAILTTSGNAVATTLASPVGVVTGVRAAGAAPAASFQAVIEGEVIVRLEAGLSLAEGQRLYVSPNTDGVATNIEPVQYAIPIGVIKSAQANSNFALVALGVQNASDQDLWANQRFLGINVSPSPVYSVVGAAGVQSGRPALRTTAGGLVYGTGGNAPLALGVIQSPISQTQDSNLVYVGRTLILLEVGLTPLRGNQLYLSVSVSGRATNVKTVTAHRFIVPLGVIVDPTPYGTDSTVLCLFNPDRAGFQLGGPPPP